MIGENGPDLGGFCGEASFRLRRILEAVGFQPTTISGVVNFPNGNGGHWWLKLHGRYIDITGDQFNEHLPKRDKIPKVLIRPISQCHLYVALHSLETFLTVNGAPAHYADSAWQDDLADLRAAERQKIPCQAPPGMA
jgi:hypothetical protein